MFDKIQIRPDEEGTQVALHDLEADVMDVVWDREWTSFAVRDVLDVLQEQRDIAYTTVMTTVKRLYDKGLFEREKDGRRYLYSPVLSREEFHQRLAVEVLGSLPDSGREAAMSALIGELSDADAETLARFEKILAERKRELEDE
ncbi:MAG: BlaI/MecI/CopY family transcriptional regulator [Bradymonadaceae bacterium]